MARTPKDRSLPPEYLKEQIKAIAWLSEQGMHPEDIRLARWGMVDPTKRGVEIIRRIGFIKRKKLVRVKGTATEHFFLESRIFCAWMFVKERPRNFQRELSVNSLYSAGEIRAILDSSRLTSDGERGKMKIANVVDVQNLNRMELETAS